MIKISVVIPSFNQGHFLEETIQSVLSQNYPQLELIIIDGGSKDQSVDIIRKYEHHFKYWVSEKDSGQSEAINKGLKRCTGDVIAWLCSDDLYTPGALLKVNEVFSSSFSSIGLIHGNSRLFNSKGTIRIDTGLKQQIPERVLAGMTFPQPSAFFRKSFLDQIGLLDEKLHYGMDYEIFARLKMVSEFKYVDYCFSEYRLHEASKTTSAIAKFITEWTMVFNSIVNGLELNETQLILKESGISTSILESTETFFKKFSGKHQIDERQLAYHHLVNILRFDYASGRFDRCRKIGNYISLHFQNNLKLEPEISQIIRRSKLPSPILRLARYLINFLQSK